MLGLPGLGVPELMLLLVLALIIFGPGKLPDIGRSFGRAIGEFRRASQELTREYTEEAAKVKTTGAGEPETPDKGEEA